MSARQSTLNKENGFAIISLGNPPKGPSETTDYISILSGLCSEVVWDRDISVLVFIGSEKDSFSMGEDLILEFSKINLDFLERLGSFSVMLSDFSSPIIAALDGNVIGLGLELALTCDIRFASEKSRFGFPHIKAGLIPWEGGTQRLSRAVGKAKAMEMMFLGEPISAQEAYRIGLVERLIPQKDFKSDVLAIAGEMASRAPISMQYTKEAVNKGMDMTLGQGLRLEADLYFLLHTTKDRIEGIKAFQEKRKVEFDGQ